MRLGFSASFLIVIGFGIMRDILIVLSQFTEVAYNPNVPSTPLSAAMPSIGILSHVALVVSPHLVNVVKITSTILVGNMRFDGQEGVAEVQHASELLCEGIQLFLNRGRASSVLFKREAGISGIGRLKSSFKYYKSFLRTRACSCDLRDCGKFYVEIATRNSVDSRSCQDGEAHRPGSNGWANLSKARIRSGQPVGVGGTWRMCSPSP